MYGEIVTRLRYKPAELKNTTLTINGTKASLPINPTEIPFPVLSDYEYCTIFLESFETNKDTLYEVKYEIHYKWNELLYKIGEVTSVNGKAEFPRLIKGMSYYVTAIPLDGKYQSKQVRITLDEYDIRQEPVAITTYENPDYKNYEHYLILKNIFGDVAVYLEGNPDYISLDRNDKNLRVYLNKDATERASEFDLIIEDYRIEDIIIARKKILVNDGFSTPYNISIEFTDSNAAIFKWSIDGIYEINKFYISDNIINKGNPIDVIGTSTYIITNYDISKTQYLRLSSLRDGKEKFSDPVTIDAFDKSLNPLIGPSVNYSINQNNDLAVYLNHNSTTVDNYSVYLEENEIASINGLTPFITSTSKNIVIPNFDVYNNYDRTLKLLATTNKYNHSYIGDNKDLYAAYDWTPTSLQTLTTLIADNIIIDSFSRISQITDTSGNARHAVQTSDDRKPILTSINSQKALQFDGSNDFLWISDTSYLKDQNILWVFWVGEPVFKTAYASVFYAIYRQNGGSKMNFSLNNGKPAFGGRRIVSDSYAEVASTENISAKASINFGHRDFTTKTAILFNDGLQTSINNNVGTAGTADSSELCGGALGAYVTALDGSNFSEAYIGKLGCMIVGSGILSEVNRQKLEGWAAHKYGLTDNLPVDHPYKNRRPVIDHTPYNLTVEFKDD